MRSTPSAGRSARGAAGLARAGAWPTALAALAAALLAGTGLIVDLARLTTGSAGTAGDFLLVPVAGVLGIWLAWRALRRLPGTSARAAAIGLGLAALVLSTLLLAAWTLAALALGRGLDTARVDARPSFEAPRRAQPRQAPAPAAPEDRPERPFRKLDGNWSLSEAEEAEVRELLDARAPLHMDEVELLARGPALWFKVETCEPGGVHEIKRRELDRIDYASMYRCRVWDKGPEVDMRTRLVWIPGRLVREESGWRYQRVRSNTRRD